MTIIATTERLNLRLITPADAAFYVELVNEPAWIRFIGERNIRTPGQAERFIIDSYVGMQAQRGHSLYLVERKSDGAALGMCGLIKRDTLVDVDLGYALLKRYWGQGYAFEAASAVVAHARDALGLARLAAITKPDNDSSNSLLRKLGFSFERRTSFEPGGSDTNVYGLDFPPK